MGACNTLMTDTDGISEFQSFSERTQKYGRNAMVSAAPILVFGYVPVNLEEFRLFFVPFNEGVSPTPWIWGGLLALLVYYSVRFFGLAIPDLVEWNKQHGEIRQHLKSKLNKQIMHIETQEHALAKARGHKDNEAVTAHQMNIDKMKGKKKDASAELGNYRWRRTYFWLLDAVLPYSLIVAACWTAVTKL